VNIPNVYNFAANHDSFAKMICVTRLTTKDLSDAGSSAEVNIGLTTSNFNYKIETFWPKQESDCPKGSDYDSGYSG